jgi:hypothetical protein
MFASFHRVPMLFNGLSSGHGHFDSGGPSLAQNLRTRVLPIDVETTSFSPPEIQDKTTKNMKGAHHKKTNQRAIYG